MKKQYTIGVFSASTPISATVPVRYNRGVEFLKSKGYKVVEGSLTGKKDFYRSANIKERAQEFNELIYRDDVDIVMSSIGGYNTNSILPYIDYAYLKKHPKIIVGYSDTTALLLAIYQKTGLPTFYGPAVAASFGEFPPFSEMTLDYFSSVIEGKITLPYTYEMPAIFTEEYIDWAMQVGSKKKSKNNWICVNEGKCEGRLIGGNLNTMEGFFGTEYMPEIKAGDILFIEDSLKDASVIERGFSHLKIAGVFEKISGLILGKHECFDDLKTGRKPYEILKEVMDETTIPVLAEFDCCHTHPMFTVPIGVKVALNATEKTVTLCENPLMYFVKNNHR